MFYMLLGAICCLAAYAAVGVGSTSLRGPAPKQVTRVSRTYGLAGARQAVFPSCNFSSLIMGSRMTNFCTLPVTVIGSSSTNRMYFGTL